MRWRLDEGNAVSRRPESFHFLMRAPLSTPHRVDMAYMRWQNGRVDVLMYVLSSKPNLAAAWRR
jgi:hypothetical protein